MEYELVRLSDLDEEGLKRLSDLHHSVMHTLLSDLGHPMVLRYYQIARREPSVIGICAISASNEVFGWAMGSPHPDRINSRLRTPLPWFALQMLRVVFTHPFVLWQLITSVLSSSAENECQHDGIELTYIGTASNQRKQGLGRKLLNAFIEASRSAGYRLVVLSVETDNKPAITLYEKSGFKTIKTYSEGRYLRHRMELTLE